MRENMMKYNGVVLFVIVLFIFGFATTVYTSSVSSSLAAQDSQISDLESKITLKEQSVLQAEATAVKTVTGLDSNRVKKDNETAAKLFKYIMSWDTLKKYNDIRIAMVEKYKLKENDSFLTLFMPPVVEAESPDGTKYNRIDTLGLNVHFEDMNSYCTGIKNTTYSYASFVSFSSSSKTGNEGFATVMATYDVDIDGNISNLKAYTVKSSK